MTPWMNVISTLILLVVGFPQVLKEMDPMHCVIEDLSQDVQTLVSRHGGATLSVARTPSGREIVSALHVSVNSPNRCNQSLVGYQGWFLELTGHVSINHQVPISRSTSVTDSIVGAIESVSSSLATRCAQVPSNAEIPSCA